MDEMSNYGSQHLQNNEEKSEKNFDFNEEQVGLIQNTGRSNRFECEFCRHCFDVENYSVCNSCNRKICEECRLKNKVKKETPNTYQGINNFFMCENCTENDLYK
jgi:hypothetical protein